MLATGRSYQMATMQIIYMALIGLFALFSAPYGVNAVAVAVSAAMAASFVLYAVVSCRMTGVTLWTSCLSMVHRLLLPHLSSGQARRSKLCLKDGRIIRCWPSGFPS